jgi:uncharacterized protein
MPPPPTSMLLPAAAFEGALTLVAIALGWLLGVRPDATLAWSWVDLGIGLAAVLPLLLGVVIAVRFPEGPLGRMFRLLDEYVVPIFKASSLIDLLIVAVLAGISEELLFRGVVQAWLAVKIPVPAGMWIGLAGSAVLFGLAHCITPTYGIVAGLIGLYLGGIWIVTGNLLAPVVAHAAYDFLVLAYLVKVRS